MIDATFVKAIEELTKSAGKPTLLAMPDDGWSSSRLLIMPGGEYVYLDVDAPPRDHKTNDLETLCCLAEIEANEDPIFWVTKDRVHLQFFSEKDPDGKAVLFLPISPQLRTLIEWDKLGSVTFEQGPLITKLRTVFHGCLDAKSDLIGSLRIIKFATSESGESAVTKGKSSVGRNTMAELTGTKELPDEFTLTVPMFAEGFESKQEVRVALDALPEERSFRLVVFAGDIAAAYAQSEAEIQAAIKKRLGETTLVYRGTP